MGFTYFAGSTLVHSVGGGCALTGAIILGACKGKYTADGRVNPIPGANMPLAPLGTFVVWFGWFGFNGGLPVALGSAMDVTAISIVYVNTNIAAVGGVGSVSTQLIGIIVIGSFVIVTSSIVWFILKATVGFRIDEEDEDNGSDMVECGIEAYPEFGRGSKTM